MRGISHLQFLRKLTKDIDADWPGVASALERALELLLNRRSMIFNATLDQAAWARLEPRVQLFISDLPGRPAKPPEWPLSSTPAP